MKIILNLIAMLCIVFSSIAQNNCGPAPTETNVIAKSAVNKYIVWQNQIDDTGEYRLTYQILNSRRRSPSKSVTPAPGNNYIELPLLENNKRYSYVLERKCPSDAQYQAIRIGEFFTGDANGAEACNPSTDATNYVKYGTEAFQGAAEVFWQYTNDIPFPARGSNLDAYTIRYRKMGTTTWEQLNSAFPKKEIRNLKRNTTYEYQVDAECEGGGRTAYSQSFFFTTLPVVTNNWNQRQISYDKIMMNNKRRNSLTVSPGEEVTLSFDWMVAPTGKDGYCPGCIIQLYVGMKDQFSECFTSRTFRTPNFRVTKGNKSVSFTAPASPGTYYITQGVTLKFSCQSSPNLHSANPKGAIASIVVK